MKNTLRVLRVVSAFALASSVISWAETRYVDQRYAGSDSDGSSAKPYKTIQAAISDQSSDLVVVYPGTYEENLAIQKSIRLWAYDGPHTTRIAGTGTWDVIYVAPSLAVDIRGFTISGGKNGIQQPNQGFLQVDNCIFCSQVGYKEQDGTFAGAGLRIVPTTGKWPTVRCSNSIFLGNRGSGIYVENLGNDYFPNMTVQNCIFLANGRYALESYVHSDGRNGGLFTHNYNDAVDNVLGQYSPVFSVGGLYPPGPGSFSQAPAFVAGAVADCGQDLRLAPDSPCINKGDPGAGYLDPDGTRNDLGAYGGPGARTFFTSPNDGPIVRDVIVEPSIIPKGESFTIQARGTVR